MKELSRASPSHCCQGRYHYHDGMWLFEANDGTLVRLIRHDLRAFLRQDGMTRTEAEAYLDQVVAFYSRYPKAEVEIRRRLDAQPPPFTRMQQLREMRMTKRDRARKAKPSNPLFARPTMKGGSK